MIHSNKRLKKVGKEMDIMFKMGYEQATLDIEKGKNLRKRMYDIGYEEAIREFEKMINDSRKGLTSDRQADILLIKLNKLKSK